jgi:hypothetical protein
VLFGFWRGSQSFQPNILEFDLHPFVVDLQPDRAVGQLSAFGIVSEHRSKVWEEQSLTLFWLLGELGLFGFVFWNARDGWF